jgi:hypothetical protein
MKKIVLLFGVILLLVSCKQSECPAGNMFFFEAPQPINDSELTSIPNKFQGIYMNSDSVYLNIKKNIIYTESEFKFRIHKNQTDSLKQDFYIENGKYISKNKKEVFNSKVIGDSIELAYKDVDTFFSFSDIQKAKRINGRLVLNQKDSIYWKVKLMSLNKNTITIKQLYSDNDLKRMDSITKNHSKMIDSARFIISPSRKEFSKFLELKNFGFDHKYRKISK